MKFFVFLTALVLVIFPLNAAAAPCHYPFAAYIMAGSYGVNASLANTILSGNTNPGRLPELKASQVR